MPTIRKAAEDAANKCWTEVIEGERLTDLTDIADMAAIIEEAMQRMLHEFTRGALEAILGSRDAIAAGVKDALEEYEQESEDGPK